MRILILSDIHANLTALETVLTQAGKVDAVWCLGDLVGYGPDPNESVNLIRHLPNLSCILGNHDAATVGLIDVASFNIEARQAIYWTQSQLSEGNKTFLKTLPEELIIDNVTLAHGSPRHPIWEYLLDTRSATLSFGYFETPFCFVGHSHLPVAFELKEGSAGARLLIPVPEEELVLQPRTIINPGSVGQPRDRNPQAAYALFDTETHIWISSRVGYPIREVQERMIAAGLPSRHIERLAGGW